MSTEREDQGECEPAAVFVDVGKGDKGAFVMVVHAGIDSEALRAETEAIERELLARGVAILEMEMGTIEGVRIRSVPFDEFMPPAPPRWPMNIVKARPECEGVAQWKREKDRYRFRR